MFICLIIIPLYTKTYCSLYWSLLLHIVEAGSVPSYFACLSIIPCSSKSVQNNAHPVATASSWLPWHATSHCSLRLCYDAPLTYFRPQGKDMQSNTHFFLELIDNGWNISDTAAHFMLSRWMGWRSRNEAVTTWCTLFLTEPLEWNVVTLKEKRLHPHIHFASQGAATLPHTTTHSTSSW